MALVPIKRKSKKRRFYTYDMEWYPETLELRLIGLYDGEKYVHFFDVDSFLNYALKREFAGGWFYAHAGGLYDFQFLLQELVRKGWEVEAAFSGSSAIIAKVSDGERNWTFIDSYWLLRQPLKEIGVWLGLEKGGDESGDIFTAPIHELIEYNERDVIILWRAIEYFENFLRNMGGQLEKTIASSALSLFKRKYLSREVNTSGVVNERAREAYIGSRVEVIQHRCVEALDYDINSSFPHSMTFPVPCEPSGVLNKKLPKSEKFLVEVTLSVPEMDIPPLPYKSKNRIFFPVGTWRTWMNDIDFRLAEETGCKIVQIHRSIGFSQFEDLANYAIDIYERRMRAESAGEKYVLKILLNSLYGKFGERAEKEKMYINPSKNFLKKCDKSRLSMVAPGIFVYKEKVDIPHEHVAIAADITARSRRSLYNFMRKCKEVYYCDTDGFACDKNSVFETSNDLGKLKLVKEVEEGIFVAPKLYALKKSGGNWEIKAKGFSKVKRDSGRSTGMNYEEFCGLLEHREVPLENFSRIRTTVKQGMFPKLVTRGKTWRGKVTPKRAKIDDIHTRPWDVVELCKE